MATIEELEARVATLESSVFGFIAQLAPLPSIKDTVDGVAANQSIIATTVQGITDRIDQEVVPLIDSASGRADFAIQRLDTLEPRVDDHESRITVLENPA